MEIEINKVYNCDCIELMQEMVRIGVYADMLLTDIPYDGVNRETNGLRNLDKGNADILTFDINRFLELADSVVKGNFVIFCGRGQISQIYKFFADKKYTTRLLVWQKNNPSPMNGEWCYLNGIECAVYARKKGATFNAFCKNTVMKHNCGEHDIHETQKPLSLWYEILNDLTKENDLVLDTCMGSFTTAVACAKLNRRFIGCEINEKYYKLGLERLNVERNQISLFDM